MEAMLRSGTCGCAFASLFSAGDKNLARRRCRSVGVSTAPRELGCPPALDLTATE